MRNSKYIRVKFLLLICVLTAGAYATSEYISKPVPEISLERSYKQADFVAVVSKMESIEDRHREGYAYTKCEVHLILKDTPKGANQDSSREIRILHQTKGDGKGGGSSRMVFEIEGIKDSWSLVFLKWDRTEDAFVPLTGQDEAAYSQFIILRPRDPLPN